MERMNIKSFYGDYTVHFEDHIDYERIIKSDNVVIIDRVVYELYKDELCTVLNTNNTIIIDATEEQKSYAGLICVINEIIGKGFHKNNTLIAIGGGIIQDCVAFIASIPSPAFTLVNFNITSTVLPGYNFDELVNPIPTEAALTTFVIPSRLIIKNSVNNNFKLFFITYTPLLYYINKLTFIVRIQFLHMLSNYL